MAGWLFRFAKCSWVVIIWGLNGRLEPVGGRRDGVVMIWKSRYSSNLSGRLSFSCNDKNGLVQLLSAPFYYPAGVRLWVTD